MRTWLVVLALAVVGAGCAGLNKADRDVETLQERKHIASNGTVGWPIEAEETMEIQAELEVHKGAQVSACVLDPDDREAWESGEEVWCHGDALQVQWANRDWVVPEGTWELVVSCGDLDEFCVADILLECGGEGGCPGYLGVRLEDPKAGAS